MNQIKRFSELDEIKPISLAKPLASISHKHNVNFTCFQFDPI